MVSLDDQIREERVKIAIREGVVDFRVRQRVRWIYTEKPKWGSGVVIEKQILSDGDSYLLLFEDGERHSIAWWALRNACTKGRV
jgi:hypothetical protein